MAPIIKYPKMGVILRKEHTGVTTTEANKNTNTSWPILSTTNSVLAAKSGPLSAPLLLRRPLLLPISRLSYNCFPRSTNGKFQSVKGTSAGEDTRVVADAVVAVCTTTSVAAWKSNDTTTAAAAAVDTSIGIILRNSISTVSPLLGQNWRCWCCCCCCWCAIVARLLGTEGNWNAEISILLLILLLLLMIQTIAVIHTAVIVKRCCCCCVRCCCWCCCRCLFILVNILCIHLPNRFDWWRKGGILVEGIWKTNAVAKSNVFFSKTINRIFVHKNDRTLLCCVPGDRSDPIWFDSIWSNLIRRCFDASISFLLL